MCSSLRRRSTQKDGTSPMQSNLLSRLPDIHCIIHHVCFIPLSFCVYINSLELFVYLSNSFCANSLTHSRSVVYHMYVCMYVCFQIVADKCTAHTYLKVTPTRAHCSNNFNVYFMRCVYLYHCSKVYMMHQNNIRLNYNYIF